MFKTDKSRISNTSMTFTETAKKFKVVASGEQEIEKRIGEHCWPFICICSNNFSF